MIVRTLSGFTGPSMILKPSSNLRTPITIWREREREREKERGEEREWIADVHPCTRHKKDNKKIIITSPILLTFRALVNLVSTECSNVETHINTAAITRTDREEVSVHFKPLVVFCLTNEAKTVH